MDIVLLFLCRTVPARENRRFLAWVVIATVAVETVLGIAQSIGLLENRDPQFIIGGSMTNPGAYAGYLGVTTPLILSLLVSYKKQTVREYLLHLGRAFYLSMLSVNTQSLTRSMDRMWRRLSLCTLLSVCPISTRYQLLE